MNIDALSDKQLIDDLRELVSQEREMHSVVVRYLAQVEKRKVALNIGFPSTYAFCVETLRYSEAEAITRIRAARLFLEIPTVIDALEDGKLSLTVAARAQACFQREKETSLTVRKAILEELFNRRLVDADRILATHFPQTPSRERKVPIDAELTKLEFIIPNATKERLEKYLDLRSHKNPYKRLDLMLDDLLNLGLRKYDPEHPRRKWNRKKEATAFV